MQQIVGGSGQDALKPSPITRLEHITPRASHARQEKPEEIPETFESRQAYKFKEAKRRHLRKQPVIKGEGRQRTWRRQFMVACITPPLTEDEL